MICSIGSLEFMVTRSQSKKRIDREKDGRGVGSTHTATPSSTYSTVQQEREWVQRGLSDSINATGAVTLDPTAGGGKHPIQKCSSWLEQQRIDLNPVAALIRDSDG